MSTIVVVGGSTGGVRSVQALRRAGFEGELVLVSDELHLPYDRPPLSKEVLAETSDGSPVPLLSVADVATLDVTLRLGHRAVTLDPSRRVVGVVDAAGAPAEISYDTLVIATGVEARRLPDSEEITGVHVIRRLEDAQSLRRSMRSGGRAVVIGAGFIGAEFASAARARGMEVAIVEAQDVPLGHVLGAEVGARVAAVHEAHGVAVRTGRVVAELLAHDGHVAGVRLDDGTELAADVVVVGIGASPATAWLEGSGLPLSNGVECDEDLAVVGFPGIYAVGDVALWPHAAYEEPIRVEHWTNAGDHAGIMAAHVTGGPRPAPALPYVWSDQYGHRIQIVGRPSAGEAVSVTGSMRDGDLVALYATSAGSLVGALVVDDPRLFMRLRKAIAAGASADEVAAAAASA